MRFWMYTCYFYAVVTFASFLLLTIVVTVGGVSDLRYLFKSLREQALDETDDGRVE